MTDEVVTPATPAAPVQPPASEPTPPATTEPMIPKSRLDEVLAAKKKAEEALQKYTDAEDKRKREALSEVEKLKLDKETAEKLAQEAKSEAEKARLEANAKLLKSAVLLKAAALGFEHPADAFALMDVSQVKEKDGEYDEASIEAALKPLIGRLPVKNQGAGIGTPKLGPAAAKQTDKKPIQTPRFIRY